MSTKPGKILVIDDDRDKTGIDVPFRDIAEKAWAEGKTVWIENRCPFASK